MSPPNPTSDSLPTVQSVAYPLDEFYARSGLRLPPLERVDGQSLPEPYKSLLVHERDMTSTLEAFHRGRLHLRLVGRQQIGREYFREVVLALEGSETPVEFGAIRIHLDRFDPETRSLILAERLPLGRILNDRKVLYASQPKAYLRLASDPIISELLRLRGVHILFGRRNTLLNRAGEPLAEIVEILPPTSPAT